MNDHHFIESFLYPEVSSTTMAKAEQIITDRKKMKKILEFMEEAVKEGLSKKEIMSQIDLMLDKGAQKRIKKSEKEIKEGKTKRFKSAKEAIAWLHSEE
jgi:hypothetical protein